MAWIADSDLTEQKLYKECSSNIRFDKNDLDTAILHHSELVFVIGEAVARHTSMRDEAKNVWKNRMRKTHWRFENNAWKKAVKLRKIRLNNSHC